MLDHFLKFGAAIGLVCTAFTTGQNIEAERNIQYSKFTREQNQILEDENKKIKFENKKLKDENIELSKFLQEQTFNRNSSGEAVVFAGKVFKIFPGVAFRVFSLSKGADGRQFAQINFGEKFESLGQGDSIQNNFLGDTQCTIVFGYFGPMELDNNSSEDAGVFFYKCEKI